MELVLLKQYTALVTMEIWMFLDSYKTLARL